MNPVKKTYAALAAAALLCGACSTTPTAPTIPDVAPAIPGTAVAVITYLTHVDPKAYGGAWDGACPGTDVDAAKMAALCRARAIPYIALSNETATSFRFLSACAGAAKAVEAAAKAGAKPLVVIYYSGHGGQVADTGGDEADGKDETICLWDGQLTDDVMYAGLCKFPEDCLVAFITDSCNSGTNFKSPKDWVKIVRARSSRAQESLKCMFIHIGGCADGESSFGGDDGGQATMALDTAIRAYRPMILASDPPQLSFLSWKAWPVEAQALMPRNQRLTYAEFNIDGATREAMK